MNHYRSSYTSHAAAKKTFARMHLCKSGYVVMKPGSVCECVHTNLDGYKSCQRMIHYYRPRCFVRSHGGCCSAVCAAVSMHCRMKQWRMFTKSCKVKSIPYVATGLPANVFLTVWGMWKFYHCASEKCTIQICEALLGMLSCVVSLIRPDLIS